MSRPESATRFAERGKPYWPLTFALLGLVLVGSMALGPVLRDSAWWWVMAAVATITFVSAGLFRRLGWSGVIVPLASAGALIVTLTLFFGAGSGLLWLIPTPGTFEVWGALLEEGNTSIQQQAVPAVPYPGIVFLLALGAGGIALVVDAIGVTLRLPAVAGALVLIPVAVPAMVSKEGGDLWMIVATAIVYLLVLRVDVRIRRTEEADTPIAGRTAPRTTGPERRGVGPVWSSVGVGAVAIVSALVLSAATPAISASSLIPSQSGGVLFGSGVNPLIDLGQDLRRPEETSAFHYSTTSDRAPYFKLLTLDQFSEEQDWVASHAPADSDNTIDAFARPPGLTDQVSRDEIETHVQVDGVVSSWLPVPYPSSRINGLSGTWTWADDALTVSSEESTTSGQSYDVESLFLRPTADQLRAAGQDYPLEIEQYLALPDEMSDTIALTAVEATAGTTNPYDAAIALQRYFRSSEYAYSTEAPVEDGYDGSSLGVIEQFLEAKKGYCIHFASAMAVMARTLGIPSRLALGYLPGESTRDTYEGLPRWNVTSHDLHTWPELYFPDTGWVAFEPTTGRGSIPDYARASGALPASSLAPSAADRADTEGQDPSTTGAGGQGGTGGIDPALLIALQIAGIVIAVVLIALVPFFVRRGQRASRRIRVSRGQAPPSLLWTELTATALDHGAAVPETETARHLAARLLATPHSDVVEESMHRLLDAVERERYARTFSRPAARELVRDLEVLVRWLDDSAPFGVRMRARLLPRSLRPSVLDPERGRVPTAA